ncbi:MAG: hypothetical protein IE916_00185 [Epsilonproteobacteria bacterium]|nr:hypothetical protein [Campylobacterota bacterium]
MSENRRELTIQKHYLYMGRERNQREPFFYSSCLEMSKRDDLSLYIVYVGENGKEWYDFMRHRIYCEMQYISQNEKTTTIKKGLLRGKEGQVAVMMDFGKDYEGAVKHYKSLINPQNGIQNTIIALGGLSMTDSGLGDLSEKDKYRLIENRTLAFIEHIGFEKEIVITDELVGIKSISHILEQEHLRNGW